MSEERDEAYWDAFFAEYEREKRAAWRREQIVPALRRRPPWYADDGWSFVVVTVGLILGYWLLG